MWHYIGYGDLNSGPHTYVVGASTTEPSHKFIIYIYILSSTVAYSDFRNAS